MPLPAKSIKKIKVTASSEACEIIPERLQSNGFEAVLPTLNRDSIIGMEIEIVDLTTL